jgi:short-subunit dehydrogenase
MSLEDEAGDGGSLPAMRVCIVGASGKLGQYMVQHALDRSYQVVGVCRERSVVCSMSAQLKNTGECGSWSGSS